MPITLGGVQRELEDVEDELLDLYRQQSSADRAASDGRVSDHVLLRQTVNARAERIRRLEQHKKRLLRDIDGGIYA